MITVKTRRYYRVDSILVSVMKTSRFREIAVQTNMEKIMEGSPLLTFHVQFMNVGVSGETPPPGIQLFAFDSSTSILESSDFRKSNGTFFGNGLSWNKVEYDSYTAEIDTKQLPSHCQIIVLLARVSSSLSMRDLAHSMSYSLSVSDDLSVRVNRVDLTFTEGNSDWFIVGAVVFNRSSSFRVLMKDISSFPETRGNVIGQLRDLVQSTLREAPPCGISLPNWYLVWDSSRKNDCPMNESSVDRTAILTSRKIPYLDDPNPSTSPRSIMHAHQSGGVLDESCPTSPNKNCARCRTLMTRISQLEIALGHTDVSQNLVAENNALRDRIAELEIQLQVTENLVEKLKQVHQTTEHLGFAPVAQSGVPDFSHLGTSQQFSANLKLQEDLLVSVKEQVMRIGNQLSLGQRLRGIPLPSEINQIHMS